MKTTLIASGLLVLILNLARFVNTMPQQRASMLARLADSTIGRQATGAGAPDARSLTHTSTPARMLPIDSSATDIASRLTASGLKPDYASLYLGAQVQTGTPWQLLAAVHQVETGQSDSTSRTSSAGATGPMQFMPVTFRAYAMNADGTGSPDITNVNDAVLTAGRYLAAGGADRGQYRQALYNYNHSDDYVSHVMSIADTLGL